MSLNIRRVTAIPAELAANTIYLVADGTDGLVVAVTNAAAELVRKTKTSAEIQTLINNASTDSSAALAAAVQSLQDAIAAEALTRGNADTALSDALAAETLARQNANTTLQGNLDTEVAALEAADLALDGRITANSNALSAEVTNREAAVAGALQDSKDYTDAQIASLDMSNAAVFAADIAARDALVLSKNSFVFVADASADATVDTGAALYFYNLATTSYTKVAEYESMDFVIPNLDILADLSDINGALGYKGSLVATVLEGAHEW